MTKLENTFDVSGFHDETRFTRAGGLADPLGGAANVPVYQTSIFGLHGFDLDNEPYSYSRTANPTRAYVERYICELEGATDAFAFASGMAAVTAVLSLLSSGDEVVIQQALYGGSYRVLNQVFNRFGIGYTVCADGLAADVRAAMTPRTKMIYLESPGNPMLGVADIRAAARIAHESGAILVIDNTFMTPWLQRPLELGADIVLHSATKYLGGHNVVLAGLVVTSDPDLAERVGFIQNATGGVLAPMESFLLVQGMKTLALRMEHQTKNAQFVAEQLETCPDVARVHYPGLLSDPGHDLQLSQAKNGGAMLSFEIADGHDYLRFFQSLRLVTFATSLGGTETLACHPNTDSNSEVPAEVRAQMGITDALVRMAIGIEDQRDIWNDVEQALVASRM